MKLTKEQQEFVYAWGTFGTNWGINKTMAQLHALMLIAEEALSTEEMMETLQISRGNANMNVRALVEWGLATKTMVAGDRKDYYLAKKDIWDVARQIAKQRRQRELEPVISTLSQLKASGKDNTDNKELVKRIDDIEDFAIKVDSMLDKFIATDSNWFYKVLMKLV